MKVTVLSTGRTRAVGSKAIACSPPYIGYESIRRILADLIQHVSVAGGPAKRRGTRDPI